eukprot:3437718-Rhodomonas_salina.1
MTTIVVRALPIQHQSPCRNTCSPPVMESRSADSLLVVAPPEVERARRAVAAPPRVEPQLAESPVQLP